MAKRIVRLGSQQLRDQLALAEALEPIEEAHLDAKEAYRELLEACLETARNSGDPDLDPAAVAARAALAEAKVTASSAANHLEVTRTWLRREAAIVQLSTSTIPELQRRLAGPILRTDGVGDDAVAVEDVEERARLEARLEAATLELELFTADAIPVRRELEQLGGVVVGGPVPPDLPPGSASVTAPTIATQAVVNRRPKGGK